MSVLQSLHQLLTLHSLMLLSFINLLVRLVHFLASIAFSACLIVGSSSSLVGSSALIVNTVCALLNECGYPQVMVYWPSMAPPSFSVVFRCEVSWSGFFEGLSSFFCPIGSSKEVCRWPSEVLSVLSAGNIRPGLSPCALELLLCPDHFSTGACCVCTALANGNTVAQTTHIS